MPITESSVPIRTATRVKTLLGFTGAAALYRLDPPLELTEYDAASGKYVPNGETQHVIVSATNVPFSGPETYIFPATADGEIADWGELDGSYKGGLDHTVALHGARYEVAS